MLARFDLHGTAEGGPPRGRLGRRHRIRWCWWSWATTLRPRGDRTAGGPPDRGRADQILGGSAGTGRGWSDRRWTGPTGSAGDQTPRWTGPTGSAGDQTPRWTGPTGSVVTRPLANQPDR